MNETICGHDRETLISALRLCADADELAIKVAIARANLIGLHNERTLALQAVIDPAKLAELWAEALRMFGVGCVCEGKDGPFGDGVLALIRGHESPNWFTMPQARAALLRVLELSDGATAEDALKAVWE